MKRDFIKIAGIISIVIGGIYCLTIVGVILGIPLIIGGLKFNEYSTLSDKELVDKKDSILIWSIFFFLFSIIGGVLGFIAYLSITGYINEPGVKKDSLKSKLEELNELKEKGLITETEYKKRKAKILDE